MKRSLIIILLCVLAMTQFGFAFSASADTSKEPLKILAVGNSFSVDAMQYLWDIAADAAHLRIYVPRFPNVTLTAGGDLNGDGKVGVADVIRLLKYIAEQK